MDIDLSLLCNLEIEKEILSIAMNKYGLLRIQAMKVKVSEFYSDKHKVIFEIILKVYQNENDINIVLITDYLNNNKELISKVGGISYVINLSAAFLSNEQIETLVKKLRDYKLRRDIYNISKKIEINLSEEPKKLANLIHNEVIKIQDQAIKEKTQAEYIEEYLSEKQLAYEGKKEAINTIKTGLIKLDDKIRGFSEAELITIYAFSSVGKSVLALQIALNMARQKKKILFFSLEMNYKQVMDRLMANVLNMPVNSIRNIYNKNISENKMDELINKAAAIYEYIEILNTSNYHEIVSKIQIEKIKGQVDIVFIDYIGLIEGLKANDRTELITKITRGLKKLALDLKIPIVIVAQANQKTAEKSSNKQYKSYEKLGDTDIADSASVYRDSDIVLGLYRDKTLEEICKQKDNEVTIDETKKDPTVNPNCVQIYVNKCRNSTRQVLSFKWNGEKAQINNYLN